MEYTFCLLKPTIRSIYQHVNASTAPVCCPRPITTESTEFKSGSHRQNSDIINEYTVYMHIPYTYIILILLYYIFYIQ